MKYLITIAFTFSSLFAISQCEPPIVTNWHAENDSVFNIDFLASESSSEYIVTFISMYTYDAIGMTSEEFLYPNEASYTGDVESGLNSVSLDPTVSSIIPFITYPYYYYKVKLGTICSNDTIWGDDFYMSTNSLFNNDGILCSHLEQPFAFLADTDDNQTPSSTQVTFEVDGDSFETIDNMSILLDIGHSFVADLTIELTSPSGTTIILLPQILAMSNSAGFSVLFQDGAPELSTYPSGGDHVSGIYAPEESFSAFNGESPVGTWTITFNDNFPGDIGFLFGVCLNINQSPCVAYLGGNTYLDWNLNGINDDQDTPFPFGVVSSNEGIVMIGNAEGDYYSCFPEGNQILQLENIPQYYTLTPDNYTLDISEGDLIEDIDFALQPVAGINDLSVDVFHVEPDRPGFENTFYIDYSNVGTECIDDVTLMFESNEFSQIINVEGFDVSNLNDSIASLNLGTLCPFENGTIQVTIQVDPSVQIGDELTYSATISPIVDDNNAADNTDSDITTVVGSFDPNDKMVNYEVISPDFIAQENSLEYLIRFQNTGNYYAEKVVIRDVLDENLIPSTLIIKDASHAMHALVYGDELIFEFNDIFLPASQDNEEASHGFVRFSMQPKPTFGINDTIANTGRIYFDFNEPIITNTVTTVMGIDIHVNEENIQPVRIYPNPTAGIVHIPHWSKNTFVYYQLNDLLGSEVQSGKILNDEINFEKINSGLYSLILTNANGSRQVIQKLLIEK